MAVRATRLERKGGRMKGERRGENVLQITTTSQRMKENRFEWRWKLDESMED